MAIKGGFGVTETAHRRSIPMKTLVHWVAQYRQDKQEFMSKPGVSGQALN